MTASTATSAVAPTRAVAPRKSRRHRAFAAAAATLCATAAATATTTGSAHAADFYLRSCSTTGAVGTAEINIVPWDEDEYSAQVKMTVRDTLGDGHHVRIRFIQRINGVTFFEPWQYNYGGVGTQLTFRHNYSAFKYPEQVGVQVARYEKDDYLNSCSDWT